MLSLKSPFALTTIWLAMLTTLIPDLRVLLGFRLPRLGPQDVRPNMLIDIIEIEVHDYKLFGLKLDLFTVCVDKKVVFRCGVSLGQLSIMTEH